MKRQVFVEIDEREDDEVILDFAKLFSLNDDVQGYRTRELPAGDLAVGVIGFERKTMSDFASSMLKGRLEEQAIKMNQHYQHGYILVEGDLAETENPFSAVKSNISPEALRGLMASLTARKGLPVIHCSTRALLADMAVRLARKHIEQSRNNYIPRGPVTGSNEPTAKKMYACIPGIGPEKAETLYDEWPCVTALVNTATTGDIAELEGFGPKTAHDVLEAFR